MVNPEQLPMEYEEFNDYAEEMMIDLMMRDAGWVPEDEEKSNGE